MHYAIQAEKDLNRVANAAGDDIGTNFVICDEHEAEHFAVYKSASGQLGTFELADDFPSRWAAEAYVALCKIRDIDTKLNDPKGDGSGEGAEAPAGSDFNDVLAIALDILKSKEEPNG